MSESFEIRSSQRDYRVRIGSDLLDGVLSGSTDVILCDAAIRNLWPQVDGPRTLCIPAEESEKNLETCAGVIAGMREAGANRQTRMVAVGGGVIQDVATFVASVYMRGIEWIYLPTTLLGMVDSCIGGKSSINVGQFKNIAGNFYPPREILVDTRFCRTLQTVQKAAGLCEAAKICFADRGAAFDDYLRLAQPPELFERAELLAGVISLSLRTKKRFVEEDEFDQGARLLLNFGHTFGHALEGATGFSISHGVAVGVGMIAALDLSRQTGFTDGRAPRIAQLVQHIRALLRPVPRLSAQLAGMSALEALRCFKADKKHRKDAYAAILVDRDGHLERRFLPINGDTESRILAAFESVRRGFDEVQ